MPSNTHYVPQGTVADFFLSHKDDAASENAMMVIVDEQTGDSYARAVGQKGAGGSGEMEWLLNDIDKSQCLILFKQIALPQIALPQSAGI